MAGYNQKKKENTMRYLATLKEIRFRVRMDTYERYCQAVKASGYPSMRQFYIDAIEEKIKRMECDETT